MRIPSTVSDQYIYFVAVDSTDFTTRETGLSSFTVYRSRNGGAATAMTTPTINEVDATNMPGVYELLCDEDMTIDSGDQSQEICFHITHAGMAPVTRTIEIYRPSVSLGNTIAVSGARANCDVVAVSGDTTAADNLEAAYDGTGYDVGGIDVSELNSIVDDLLDAGRLDALIDAIKAKTDSLTFTVAGNVDSNPQSWDDTLLAVTNPFDNVATSVALATVDSNVDAILVDTGTTLPAQISGLNNLSTADIDARLTAFGWASITISAVSGAVGSVTGNVGGNVVGSVASVTGNVGGIAGTIQTLDALDTAQDTQHSTTQSAISGLNDLDAAGVRAAVGLASANLDTQLGYITDYSAYSLTVLAGAISNADNAAESYTKTLNSVAYTVTYAGLDTDGNRTSSTLSKV